MTTLYHGSGFEQQELMPGFKRSGKVVKWDGTESNEWLYATTEKEEAIAQGFASILEKEFDVERYKTSGKNIEIHITGSRTPTRLAMGKFKLYIYTMPLLEGDGWRLVNNLHNGMKNEYKTKQTIEGEHLVCESVDVKGWLEGKSIILKVNGKISMNW